MKNSKKNGRLSTEKNPLEVVNVKKIFKGFFVFYEAIFIKMHKKKFKNEGQEVKIQL
jgi:hypothetical protein